MKEYEIKYNEWINNPVIDDESKKELRGIEGNEKKLRIDFIKI